MTTRTEVKVQIQVNGKAAAKKKGGPTQGRTQVSTNASEGGVNINVVTNVTVGPPAPAVAPVGNNSNTIAVPSRANPGTDVVSSFCRDMAMIPQVSNEEVVASSSRPPKQTKAAKPKKNKGW